MRNLTEQILEFAAPLPEGTPVAATSLLHLGNRAAVDQALSRLAQRGQLIRAGRGVYFFPVGSRFGASAPSVEKAVEALAAQSGEVIVPSGAAAANSLGFTTQVPIRSVYLTLGRTRQLTLESRPSSFGMRRVGNSHSLTGRRARRCALSLGWDQRRSRPLFMN